MSTLLIHRRKHATLATACLGLLVAGLLCGCEERPPVGGGPEATGGNAGEGPGLCPSGQTSCDGLCVDLQTNSAHCGACGTACLAGSSCIDGLCACGEGLTQCTSGCVNLDRDGDNCGQCDVVCTAPQVCATGVCADACPGGQTACGTDCADLNADFNHCGQCDIVCDGGRQCTAGVCTCPVEGQSYCGGSCVDVQSDPLNCGVCGNVCLDPVCQGGQCVNDVPNCEDQTFTDRYSPGYTEPRDPDVDNLLQSMSWAEKAQQMRGLDDRGRSNWDDIQRTEDNTDKNIRGYYFRDGPRGVNLEARQHNRQLGEDYSTAYPVPVAQGASFDLELLYRVGEAMGDETVASMNTMLLLPCMNVLRHPAWGRAQETFGEDTWHLGRIASAITAGLQTYVAGCAKHYSANNIEEDRFLENANMNEQTLRETYGRHFEMVVQDGGIACIMAAYNSLNGTHCTENRHLVREMLKGPVEEGGMGFRGLVLSDWWAQPPGKETGLAASVYQENAIAALEAGLDLEVPWRLSYGQIENLIANGQVDGALVNEGAGRVLEQKYRFNSQNFDGPYGLRQPETSLNAAGSIVGNEGHLALSRELAEKSMVLLKNEQNTLPIPDTIGTIGVIGGVGLALVTSDCWSADCVATPVNFAEQIRTGDRGSSRVKSNPAQSVPPLAGIQEAAARHGVAVEYGLSAAEVPNAQLLVVVVGLTAEDEGEEYTGAADRTNFRLDGKHPDNPTPQAAAIQAAIATGKPVVVVLVGGSVIDHETWGDGAKSIVMSWYPGQQGGLALGDLLFGDKNFSGKLPITWSGYSDWPTFDEGTETWMDYYVGYKWFDIRGITPRYPWGHGLSYTTFEYSNLILPCQQVTKGGVVYVQADITNTGPVAGSEVAFLFVSWPNTVREKNQNDTGNSKAPIKELRGFVKAPSIFPGETRRVTIPLRIADLKYWDMASSQWVVESGPVDIMVGPSSAAPFPLNGTITVQ